MMRLTMISAAVVLAFAALGTMGATATSMAAARANRAAPAATTCNLAQLKLAATWAQTNVTLPGGGAVQGQVALRDSGKTSCALSGFLKIQIVSANGSTLKVSEHHSGQALAPVTLKAGMVGRAVAGFDWLNWCKGGVTAPLQLKVTLPGQTTHALVSNKNKSAAGGKAASCVNPTAGSVIDVDPLLKG